MVSTQAFSSLAVASGSFYARNMNCSVTVYNPAGWAVALSFVAFELVPGADCACCVVCMLKDACDP